MQKMDIFLLLRILQSNKHFLVYTILVAASPYFIQLFIKISKIFSYVCSPAQKRSHYYLPGIY